MVGRFLNEVWKETDMMGGKIGFSNFDIVTSKNVLKLIRAGDIEAAQKLASQNLRTYRLFRAAL